MLSDKQCVLDRHTTSSATPLCGQPIVQRTQPGQLPKEPQWLQESPEGSHVRMKRNHPQWPRADALCDTHWQQPEVTWLQATLRLHRQMHALSWSLAVSGEFSTTQTNKPCSKHPALIPDWVRWEAQSNRHTNGTLKWAGHEGRCLQIMREMITFCRVKNILSSSS